jgi:gliding motility-associated-like protein
MKKVLILISLVVFAFNQSNATIYFVDQNFGSDTSNGLFQSPMTSPDGPLQSINAALSLAISGDTIIVAEGDYYEQISITKPLVLYGANSNNAPFSANRGGESILYPQLIDLGQGPNTNNTQIWILSDSVEINGFKLNGNDNNLISGENIYGVDVDLAYGIVQRGDINHVVLSNNIIVNYYFAHIYAWGGSNVTSEHVIENNYLLNCGTESIYVESEMHISISGNIISSVPKGINITNFNRATNKVFSIENNLIAAHDFGIEIHDIVAAGSFVVNGNNIQSADLLSATFISIFLNKNEDKMSFSANGNYIEGGNSGYLISNSKNKNISIKNDSIFNIQYGVYLINTQPDLRNDTLSLDGLRVYNASLNAVTVISDEYIVNVRTPGTVLAYSGNGAKFMGRINWIPMNCKFDSISNFYIRLDSSLNGRRPSTDITATSIMFNGLTGALLSNTQSFVVEDKIHHYLDDNSLGFITIKPKHIYISLIDGNNLISPAFSKAADGWDVHIRPVANTQVINVSKNLTFHTYGYSEVGMINMVGPGKILTLVGDLHFGQGITLNDGIIKSTLGNAVHLGEFAKTFGGSQTSYVDGIMFRKGYGASRDTLSFPIGKGADYRPSSMIVSYSQSSGIVEYSMELYNSALPFTSKPADIKNISKLRYWDAKIYSAAFIDNIKYNLSYANTFSDDQVIDPANLRIVSWALGSLTNLGGVGNSSINGKIENDKTITSLSPVTIANAYGGRNLIGSAGPIAAFNGANNCLGSALMFADNSNDPYLSLNYWKWDFGVNGIDDDTALGANVSYNYSDTGTYVVKLIVKNVFGQTDSITQNVIIADNPVVSFIYKANCYPDFVEFDGTATVGMGGIQTYKWDIDGFNYNTEDVNNAFSLPNSYDAQLKVTSGFGCTDSFYQSILYAALPVVVINPTGIIYVCEGDTITLISVNNHLQYSWNSSETSSSITRSSSGEVILTAHSSNNCFAADTVFVNVVPLPIVSAGNDTLIYTGTRAFLKASGAKNYLWDPSSTLSDSNVFDPVAKPQSKTTYSVIGTDDFGCIGYDSITVDLKYPTTIKVPNLVTPNGDGHNDVWDLRDVPGIDNSKIVIMDKWGSLIYESPKTGYMHNWAGKVLNIEFPEGTYYYIIELKDFKETVKGALLLVR